MSTDLGVVAPRPAPVSHARRRRTPTVLQMEAVECGAAALGSVLGFYGLYLPLERLRIDCGVSRDGSSARNLVDAARTHGMQAQGKKLDTTRLLENYSFPLIVHWEFEHFVVVEGFDRTSVFLNDPAAGPRTVSREEFDNSFTGVAIALQPSPEFKKGGHPPSMMTALRQRLRGSESALWLVVLASLLLVVPGLALPTFVRIFVDRVLIGGLTTWQAPLLIGLALAAMSAGLLTTLQQMVLQRMETRFALTTSSSFLWHVLRLPVAFYQQRYAGDIASRVALNDQIGQLLSGQLATTLLNMIVIVLYAALMFTYDVRLTLLSLVIAATNLALLTLVSRQRQDGNSYLLQEEGRLVGTAMGGLQIIETLKATGTEADFFARWAGRQAKVVNARQSLGVYNIWLQVIPSSLMLLNAALILWIGAERVIQGQMTIGMLMAFQTLAASFMAPVSQLVGMGTALQEVAGSLARLDDVLRNDVDPVLSDDPQSDTPDSGQVRLSGHIELRQVTFGYSPLSPPLIDKLDLILSPGSRVALVGSTGSGKSTIGRLVSGLLRPWSGDILFDGRPASEWPHRLVTRSVAQVDQDIAMFAGTLRDNLTLWDSTVSQASMIQACQDAAIHADIMRRPGGYGAEVREGGSNFSGGQRQRLEIARTLVGDPSILVLDEATSALDAVVEKEIDGNLRRRGCTCLIVAHRLSTVRDCDEILVLDRGQVVERGTHADMMKRNGPYARLIQAELSDMDSVEAVVTS